MLGSLRWLHRRSQTLAIASDKATQRRPHQKLSDVQAEERRSERVGAADDRREEAAEAARQAAKAAARAAARKAEQRR